MVFGQLRSDIALLIEAVTAMSTALDRSTVESRRKHAAFIASLGNPAIRLNALERQQ